MDYAKLEEIVRVAYERCYEDIREFKEAGGLEEAGLHYLARSIGARDKTQGRAETGERRAHRVMSARGNLNTMARRAESSAPFVGATEIVRGGEGRLRLGSNREEVERTKSLSPPRGYPHYLDPAEAARVLRNNPYT